ncbi:MAG: hypothetical protein MOGMAGMI_00335 [Candidatus Omnitrophica bacterium]|nr:hypothetical protein [Candidatus Omnitrophota bacterium]
MARTKKYNDVDNSQGLFQDFEMERSPRNRNQYWSSSLFNEIYLMVDLLKKDIWFDADHIGPFEDFRREFLQLCKDLDGTEKFETWSEPDTVKNWIVPVMNLLGWHDNCKGNQNPVIDNASFTIPEEGANKTYRPDLLYVDDPAEKKYVVKEKGAGDLTEAKKTVQMVVEAKYWDRLEEYRQGKKADSKRDNNKDENFKSRAPEDQIIKYLQMLNKDFGILTDGKVWRLLHKDLSRDGSHYRYFEFNLGQFMKSFLKIDQLANRTKLVDDLKYFFFLFSKNSFYPKESTPLVADLLDYSKKYADKIEDDLKKRFIDAMGIVCNALLDSAKAKKENVELSFIRDVAESHIFNVLFIRSCEVRGILTLKTTDYYPVSLTQIFDLMFGYYDPRKEDLNDKYIARRFSKIYPTFPSDGTHLYDRLINIYKIVYDGSLGFGVKGYKESIFSKEEWRFAKEHKIKNKEMLQLFFQIGFTQREENKTEYQQIPYNYFSPQQLGSIYESFLEYQIQKADADMVFEKKQWRPVPNINSEKIKEARLPTAKKAHLYFSPNNEERKDTGTYYTPHYVVNYIVEQTVGRAIEGKSSDEILKIKVCDPAMGSGHFLNAAMDFLTFAYINKKEKETMDDVDLFVGEVKRMILDKCIFGVDINPRAVKLAKMSLWLNTASINQKLENLDDQLKCGNSLLDEFSWEKEFKKHSVIQDGGFDVVVGNPPYIGEKGHKEIFEPIKNGAFGKRFYKGKMDYFYFFIHKGLDILKDKGTLSFITTNYFLTAMGASKLRADFKIRSTILEMINCNNLKIFSEASGQHNLIFCIQKQHGSASTTKARMISVSQNGKCTQEFFKKIYQDNKTDQVKITLQTQESLYDGDECYLRFGDFGNNSDDSLDAILTKKLLGVNSKLISELCEVSNGIHTQADYLSKKKYDLRDKKSSQAGDGIYVLDSDNPNDIQVENEISQSQGEKVFLKPFFKNSDIQKFTSANKSKKKIIYLNKQIHDLSKLKKIEKHLNNFKTIIEQASDNAPYLHRPKTEKTFLSPKIIAPQRSVTNTFGYNEIPWYAASDVYFITSTSDEIQLKYILGFLNSKLGYLWLYFKGKRKGDYLELTVTPLSEVPIKIISKEEQKPLVKIVESIIKMAEEGKDYTKKQDELNSLIYKLYSLSSNEIKSVEEFYHDKHSNISFIKD